MMILKPGKIYNQYEINDIMTKTWAVKEKIILQLLKKQPNLFQLKHLPIIKYIIYGDIRKLWKKYPKLLNVGVYANLANKQNN